MTDDMEWVRAQYGVPAEVGGRVVVDGKPGTIIGTSGPHLAIALDGGGAPVAAHPTWHMTYLPELRGEGKDGDG